MKAYSHPGVLVRLLALVLLAASVPPTAQAQTFKVLYSFTGGADGEYPQAGAVFDASGNLYGTTFGGGNAGCFYGTCGVVFKLTPGSVGWSESTLHTFTGGSDGGNPEDNLIFDAAGNLYGTALAGGTGGCPDYGCGVAFGLTPTSDGWAESVLYSFSESGSGGGNPTTAVVFDKIGNLYGTLPIAGSGGAGTVYELIHGTDGWTGKTLFDFSSEVDGCQPEAAPILDAAGDLYGTASYCGHGAGAGGTVWKLIHGSWKVRTLHTFKGPDGDRPRSSLTFDKAGNLYGTTQFGGKYNKGTVFKLAPRAQGRWAETILYDFKGGTEGYAPLATLIFDRAGNLYGTASDGGDLTCNENGVGCGLVFKLSVGKKARWKATVLHRFTGGSDGSYPNGDLVIDGAVNLYGTTVAGGNTGCSGGCGVVFEITP